MPAPGFRRQRANAGSVPKPRRDPPDGGAQNDDLCDILIRVKALHMSVLALCHCTTKKEL